MWPFQNVSEQLIFSIFKILSTKDELKTDKLILWFGFMKHNINIFYVFFNANMFYGKLGKKYGSILFVYYNIKYCRTYILGLYIMILYFYLFYLGSDTHTIEPFMAL